MPQVDLPHDPACIRVVHTCLKSLGLALLVISSLAPSAHSSDSSMRVIDGDTLELGNETIRLHGIDAPETAQHCLDATGGDYQCGVVVANRLRELTGAGDVECHGDDRDAYGRLIAVCWAAGLELNRILVQEGWAVAFRKYSTEYVADEDVARRERLGLWAGKFSMPWDFRSDRWSSSDESAPDPNCPIKGNINRNGERIYHTPWSRDYARTKINLSKGERWFCNEGEAVRAGWRAPQ